jgi:hypothetical protein
MNKFLLKLFNWSIYLRFIPKNLTSHKELKELIKNEAIYGYLGKKYNKYLNNLPKYMHTHEYSNKVWWCWLQGEEKAPELNKACLNSLRKTLLDREIVVISDKNYKEYVEIPDYILDKYNKGIITRTHFSDILRLELLVKYGGTWIDSSVLCTEYNKVFFDKDLFVFQNWMKVDSSICLSSWFITAEREEPILKTTKDLLYQYWKNNNYLIHYYLFHLFVTMATHKYKSEWDTMYRFSNVPTHILQFELLNEYSEYRFNQIKKMSSIHKLNQKLDFSKCNGKTNYDFIIKKYLSSGE